MEPEAHKTQSPRESLLKSDTPILRDIGNQLNMLEQNAPLAWQQHFKSILSSKNFSVEMAAKRLDRRGESELLETLFDLIIYATHASYESGADFKASATELVEKIEKIVA